MTNQTIPAEKVRELIEKFKEDTASKGIVAYLRALLPVPQPTTGLLGRWAKHPERGDVLISANNPDLDGEVWVIWIDDDSDIGATGTYVPLSSLTFPHQATRPADVPAGEAWLVDVADRDESYKSIVAIKEATDQWRTSGEVTDEVNWYDEEITLVAPLVPERPVSDLQAKYDALRTDLTATEKDRDWYKAISEVAKNERDALEAKYEEAQERIKTLEQASAPRTVSTRADYAALPIGSIVSEPDTLNVSHAAFKKRGDNRWEMTGSKTQLGDGHMAQMNLTVLQYGRGDEQPYKPKPAWRIEHDHTKLRVGDYIIDKNGNTGTIGNWWGNRCAPFIAFDNPDAATPEAVAEAKKARDKEIDK